MKKKRFFASMLALVLLLSCGILPSAAFAEGAGTSQDGLVLSKTATATVDVTAQAVQTANNGATVMDAQGWPNA